MADADDPDKGTSTGSGSGSGSGSGGEAEPAFDPYRFGKPDRPVPPEYAPPGYVPDPPAASSPPSSPYPYGAPPYGQVGQYPQQPYGRPYPQQSPYGAQYAPAPPGGARTGNGKAVTALVLGIVSIVLCWLTILDLALIIPAVIFGILGLTEASRRNGVGRRMAVAGLACAVVAAVLAVTFTVLASRAIDRCGGSSQSGEPGFTECVQDNIF